MSAVTGKNRGIKDRLFVILNYLLCTLFAIICFYPLYYLFLVSISDSNAVNKGLVILFPKGITWKYFQSVFEMNGIMRAFGVSIARTVIGTVLTLFMTSMLAYVTTQQVCKLRKLFYRGTVFTMYAGAGLIPWVVFISKIGLQNSFWVYILPGIIYAYGMVLIKTYIEQLPEALQEAALVDGAGYFTIFIRVVLPLCTPVIAALAVFTSIGQWNNFQDNFFLVQNTALQTVQMYLYNLLKQAEAVAANAMKGNLEMAANVARPNAFTIKATTAMVTIIPILFVYPLLQRFFVKGIILGAVKG